MHVCIYKRKTISLYTSNVSDSDVLSSRSRNHTSSWHLKQTTQHPLKVADLKIDEAVIFVCTYIFLSLTSHVRWLLCDVLMHCSNSLQKQVFLQCYHFYTGRERHTVTWQNDHSLYNQSGLQWKQQLQCSISWRTPGFYLTLHNYSSIWNKTVLCEKSICELTAVHFYVSIPLIVTLNACSLWPINSWSVTFCKGFEKNLLCSLRLNLFD